MLHKYCFLWIGIIILSTFLKTNAKSLRSIELINDLPDNLVNESEEKSFEIKKRNIGDNANAINVVKRPMSTNQVVSSSARSQPGSLGFDDSLRKNDDAHIRLYYKSNAPGRTVSHELEHRFIKNPNYQYNERLRQDSFNKLNPFQIPQQVYWNNMYNTPSTNSLYQDNSNLMNKDKQTMFNLHYHGNSMNDAQDYQNSLLLKQQQQQKLERESYLRNLWQQQQLQQQLQQQQLYDQLNTNDYNNGLQYRIVNLKFKVEPQNGRVLGQGYVEADNGAGPVLNTKKFSLMPKEIPDLVKKLLVSASSVNPVQQLAQQQQQQFLSYRNLMKRNDQISEDEQEISGDKNDASLLKRTYENEDENIMQLENNDEEQNENGTQNFEKRSLDELNGLIESDNDLNSSFKSMQRRQLIDEEEQQDDQDISKTSLVENSFSE